MSYQKPIEMNIVQKTALNWMKKVQIFKTQLYIVYILFWHSSHIYTNFIFIDKYISILTMHIC
jgi:hypothetical protein